jgi:protein-tyrosine sulfotransferase
MLSDNPPIFILSGARTGSTLLRFILDAHPDVCCPAELRLGQLCELLIVAHDLTSAYDDEEVGAENRQRAYVGHVRPVVSRIMNDYCRRKRKRRWCEKTPLNLDTLDHLNAVFPDARCICLHRHGLDTVRSVMRIWANDGRNPFALQAAKRYGGSVSAAHTEQWCRQTERLLAFEASYSDRTVRVQYESLVCDTERALRRLAAFLDIPYFEGWAAQAFAEPHDSGPGCNKVRSTSSVHENSVGNGVTVDMSGVTEPLRRRFLRLLERLDYC